MTNSADESKVWAAIKLGITLSVLAGLLYVVRTVVNGLVKSVE